MEVMAQLSLFTEPCQGGGADFKVFQQTTNPADALLTPASYPKTQPYSFQDYVNVVFILWRAGVEYNCFYLIPVRDCRGD